MSFLAGIRSDRHVRRDLAVYVKGYPRYGDKDRKGGAGLPLTLLAMAHSRQHRLGVTAVAHRSAKATAI
jgi:hypothetical protein